MNVSLRALEASDHSLLGRWASDASIHALTTGRRGFYSSDEIKRWIAAHNADTRSQLYLGICSSVDGRLIGYTSLQEIDHFNRSASIGGFIIGEKTDRTLPNAVAAYILLFDYAFNDLGLHRLWGKWLESHKPSLFLADLVGFKHEGVLRDAAFKNATFQSVAIRSLLRHEYLANRDSLVNRFWPRPTPKPTSTPAANE